MRPPLWLVGAGASVLLACSGDASGARDQLSSPIEPPPLQPLVDAGTPQVMRPPPPPPPPAHVDAGCDDCRERSIGSAGMAFDLAVSSGQGVVLDASGALIIQRGVAERDSFLWVADTGAVTPSISKIDTRTRREVARYAVAAPDPSRTSVSLGGDAYVGSRGGMAVTKISGAGTACPDSNGDGIVTTSSGANDVLPFGTDDCVIWSRTFDQEVRGVAAQDIAAVTTVEDSLDGPPIIHTQPAEHYVWVGVGTPGVGVPENDARATPWPMAYKLDAETGEIVLSTRLPRGAYGFALDGRGILWLTGGAFWGGSIGFIDTNQCRDTASCDVTPCVVQCSESVCPSTCDGAVKGDIRLTSSDAYGITVDCKQRVWLGGSITRYDPLAPANARLRAAPPDLVEGSLYCAGIAADASGWVWGASDAIVRIDAETLTQRARIPIRDYAHGVAIDIDGQVWAITMDTSVHVIEPGVTVTENTVTDDAVTGLDQPYTYSDMTGVQLRLAADEAPGTYRHVIEGCAEGETTWQDFMLAADTPPATRILFRARTAGSVVELEDAPWHALALASPVQTTDTVDLGSALMISGQAPGRYVEIEAELYGDPGTIDRCSATTAVSPRLLGFSAAYRCPPAEPDGPQ